MHCSVDTIERDGAWLFSSLPPPLVFTNTRLFLDDSFLNFHEREREKSPGLPSLCIHCRLVASLKTGGWTFMSFPVCLSTVAHTQGFRSGAAAALLEEKLQIVELWLF